jgi:hypothetical protein
MENFGIFYCYLDYLRPFGIFHGHLVILWYLGIFTPFWYIVPRKNLDTLVHTNTYRKLNQMKLEPQHRSEKNPAA